MGCNILICPKGKYHPYVFQNDKYIIPFNFEEKGDWDLRCYDHYTGYFLIFYLMNDDKIFYYSRDGIEIREFNNFIGSSFYDYKLENVGSDVNNHNYEYKFPIINKYGEYISIIGGILILNYDYINGNSLGYNSISKGKLYTKASINSNNSFYYFTYNNISDFTSGYSDSYIDFSNKNNYMNSIISMLIMQNSYSPFGFIDEFRVIKMNFIQGTSYVYYILNNEINGKNYFGLLDIISNKVLYNIEGEISTFIPISSSEMLAITTTSAYKICIIKNGNSCSDSCSSGNLILDPDGNKCQSDCDNGKIKMMPTGICINKDYCDLNIYTLNSDETECGLCSYFYPYEKKYKLINTTGCLSNIANNADYYNENLYLLKCKNNYHLDNDECIPDNCYERCETCFETSNDINNQKCISCINGYILNNSNCLIASSETTIPNEKETTIEISYIEDSFLSDDNKSYISTDLCINNTDDDNISCQSGYYFDEEVKKCNKCENKCKNYIENTCNCPSCPDNFGLEDNKCIECTGCISSENNSCKCTNCLNGFYLDNDDYKCKRCKEHCINYEENFCKCIEEYPFYGYYKGINESIFVLKISNLTNYEEKIYEEIRYKLNNAKINATYLDNGNYFFVDLPKTKFIFSRIDYDEGISTTVDLGECENKIKTNKTLSNNNSLYILYMNVMKIYWMFQGKNFRFITK